MLGCSQCGDQTPYRGQRAWDISAGKLRFSTLLEDPGWAPRPWSGLPQMSCPAKPSDDQSPSWHWTATAQTLPGRTTHLSLLLGSWPTVLGKMPLFWAMKLWDNLLGRNSNRTIRQDDTPHFTVLPIKPKTGEENIKYAGFKPNWKQQNPCILAAAGQGGQRQPKPIRHASAEPHTKQQKSLHEVGLSVVTTKSGCSSHCLPVSGFSLSEQILICLG